MPYIPPSPKHLQELKNQLQATGKHMAALACVGEQHWRKYTGGTSPKAMPYANLFHLAAQLELNKGELERIYNRMNAIGAQMDTSLTAANQQIQRW